MKTAVPERISEMPPEERPRERLAICGADILTDTELLSLMLGSGSGDKDVGHLASEILDVLDAHKGKISSEKLLSIRGIGTARASRIVASIEFARRRLNPSSRCVRNSADVLPLVTHWSDRKQEHFLVLSLNGGHEVTRIRVVSIGILNKTIVHPREVFVDPIIDRAAAIICAHNHPSGNLDPSQDDIALTHRLVDAGNLLGIPVLDHLIFTEGDFFSFLEGNLIK